MSNSSEWKTVLDAAIRNNSNAVENFVNTHKPDLKIKNSVGQTAAHIAAKNGNQNLVKYLLDAEPSLIHDKDDWNQTIFHLAVQSGSVNVVKYLLTSHNVSLFDSNSFFPGSSPIHIAAVLGKLDVVKYFIGDIKIDANLKNDAGQSPAFSATSGSHLPIIKYLVEETNANMTAIDDNGDNILFISARKGNLTIPKYLLDEKNIAFDVNWRNHMGETIVSRAAVFGRGKFVEYFVEEKKAEINTTDNNGSTPLHEAASSGGYALVKYLVDKGANVTATDNEGKTPKDLTQENKISNFLKNSVPTRRRRDVVESTTAAKWEDIFDAAEHGDLPAVKSFHANGTILEDANPHGETVVHIAARNANFEILNYMLDKAPKLITAKDMQTSTPLHLATQYEQLDVIKYLLDEREANLLERNYIEFGNTVLHMAAERGNLTIVKYFIEERGVDVDIKNDMAQSPMFSAAYQNRIHIVKYLFEEKKTNVTMTDMNDDNILYVTAKTGHLNLPKYLLDEKKVHFDINWQDKFGETVVMRAARWGNLDFIKYLVDEKQADINLRDGNSRTPLHEAACMGYTDLVKFLIERGADQEVRDKWNRTYTQDETYEGLMKEVQNLTKTKRDRRNVHFAVTSVPYHRGQWRQIDGATQTSIRNSENSLATCVYDSFLIFVEICTRYFRGSAYQPESNVLSPLEEIVSKRIDLSLILDAIETNFNKSEIL